MTEPSYLLRDDFNTAEAAPIAYATRLWANRQADGLGTLHILGQCNGSDHSRQPDRNVHEAI